MNDTQEGPVVQQAPVKAMSAPGTRHTHVSGSLTGLSCHTQWLAGAQGYTRHCGRLTCSEYEARICEKKTSFCQLPVTSTPGPLAHGDHSLRMSSRFRPLQNNPPSMQSSDLIDSSLVHPLHLRYGAWNSCQGGARGAEATMVTRPAHITQPL